MKKTLIALVLATGIALVAVPADTGVGGMLGDPTGVSVLLENRVALAAAWSIDDYLHLHADLWLVRDPFVEPLNWYLGLGGKVLLLGDRRGRDNDALVLGARVPVGLQWYVAPRLELFAEIAPGMTILPDTGLDVDGGIGLRFHF